MCFQKGCSSYRKSIRRNDLETAFLDVLYSVQPSAVKLGIVRRMFKSIWDSRLERA